MIIYGILWLEFNLKPEFEAHEGEFMLSTLNKDINRKE